MSTFFDWLIGLLTKAVFWYFVEPWEKAVRIRAGKYTKIILPGMHLKIPIVDSIAILNTKLRLSPSSTQTISTRDGKVITLGIQLGFSIVDPLLALSTYQHPENTLAVLVHNYAADYISDNEMADITTTSLEDYIFSAITALDPANGMLVEFCKVTDFVVSSPARTIRLVQDEIHTDYSSEASARARYQPEIGNY